MKSKSVSHCEVVIRGDLERYDYYKYSISAHIFIRFFTTLCSKFIKWYHFMKWKLRSQSSYTRGFQVLRHLSTKFFEYIPNNPLNNHLYFDILIHKTVKIDRKNSLYYLNRCSIPIYIGWTPRGCPPRPFWRRPGPHYKTMNCK